MPEREWIRLQDHADAQTRVLGRDEPIGAWPRAGVPHRTAHTGSWFPKGRCPPFTVGTKPRSHFILQCFNLSDRAMEGRCTTWHCYLECVRLVTGKDNLLGESANLRFRQLSKAQNLSVEMLTAVNATLVVKELHSKNVRLRDAAGIAAPTSARISSHKREPQMHLTKKGNQWHLGTTAHIGCDADSGPVRTVVGTVAKNTVQLHMLFGLSNLCMVRRALLQEMRG